MKNAPDILMNSARAPETGRRVIEVWEAKENSARLLAAHVAPRLPAGIHPKVTFQPLYAMVTPQPRNKKGYERMPGPFQT
jgi:hypothetical protein